MKIFFNGWFGGFLDKTNPGLHVGFFLELFEKIYNEKCQIGKLEESNILCECCMLHNATTKLNTKKWKHTFMMSGENDCRACEPYKDQYDCILWMNRNHNNIINVPLHIPYIYTNNFLPSLEKQKKRETVPQNDVLVVISNPNGPQRNKFLSSLEKKMKVTYAGRYKNNIGQLLPWDYNKPEFKNFVSQFKFIISMENTKYETGITEKITHGMIAQTIPVYWGSSRVNDYFNKERFINLKNADDKSINNTINKMIELKNDKSKWLEMVNKNVFPGNGKMWRTMDEIAKDIRCLLETGCWNHISRIYVISNKEGEPERYESMSKLFKDLKIDDHYIKFVAPTYKHTITDEQYNYHAKKQWVLRMRGPNGMKLRKGMLSLILNYRETLRDIEKNYKDGKFFIFESDIIKSKDIDKINDFLDDVNDKEWDSIHIGMFQDNIYDIPTTTWITGYRNFGEPFPEPLINYIKQNGNGKYIEDITDKNSKYRLIRKFHTRCCDSIVWKYKGIVKYLKFMDKMEQNFSCPNDYVMIDFLEKNIDFKHYWSVNEFFVQGSNLGLTKRSY